MAKRKYSNLWHAKRARREQTFKYHQRAMKLFSFRFHNVSDAKVIARLEAQKNKTDYVRELILRDIGEDE